MPTPVEIECTAWALPEARWSCRVPRALGERRPTTAGNGWEGVKRLPVMATTSPPPGPTEGNAGDGPPIFGRLRATTIAGGRWPPRLRPAAGGSSSKGSPGLGCRRRRGHSLGDASARVSTCRAGRAWARSVSSETAGARKPVRGRRGRGRGSRAAGGRAWERGGERLEAGREPAASSRAVGVGGGGPRQDLVEGPECPGAAAAARRGP